MNNPDDLVPRPDPTRLTTEALLREIANLRELLVARIETAEAKLDRAEQHHMETHQHDAELRVEQHRAFTRELELFDRRVEAALGSRDKALDVALIAVKEQLVALQSSNAATTEKADALVRSELSAVNARLTDMQERFDGKLEGVKEASTESRGRVAGREYSTAQAVTVAGLVIAFLVLIVMIASNLLSSPPPMDPEINSSAPTAHSWRL